VNRDQLVRALRSYARAHGLSFELDRTKGSGSHYWVRVGDATTIVQDKLNPGRVERILKQLGIPKDGLR
jgi:mRNA interferase HicA